MQTQTNRSRLDTSKMRELMREIEDDITREGFTGSVTVTGHYKNGHFQHAETSRRQIHRAAKASSGP